MSRASFHFSLLVVSLLLAATLPQPTIATIQASWKPTYLLLPSETNDNWVGEDTLAAATRTMSQTVFDGSSLTTSSTGPIGVKPAFRVTFTNASSAFSSSEQPRCVLSGGPGDTVLYTTGTTIKHLDVVIVTCKFLQFITDPGVVVLSIEVDGGTNSIFAQTIPAYHASGFELQQCNFKNNHRAGIPVFAQGFGNCLEIHSFPLSIGENKVSSMQCIYATRPYAILRRQEDFNGTIKTKRMEIALDCRVKSDGQISLFFAGRRLPTDAEHKTRWNVSLSLTGRGSPPIGVGELEIRPPMTTKNTTLHKVSVVDSRKVLVQDNQDNLISVPQDHVCFETVPMTAHSEITALNVERVTADGCIPTTNDPEERFRSESEFCCWTYNAGRVSLTYNSHEWFNSSVITEKIEDSKNPTATMTHTISASLGATGGNGGGGGGGETPQPSTVDPVTGKPGGPKQTKTVSASLSNVGGSGATGAPGGTSEPTPSGNSGTTVPQDSHTGDSSAQLGAMETVVIVGGALLVVVAGFGIVHLCVKRPTTEHKHTLAPQLGNKAAKYVVVDYDGNPSPLADPERYS